jgi:hypothetical protein
MYGYPDTSIRPYVDTRNGFLAQGTPPSFGNGCFSEFSANDRGVQHGIAASGGDGIIMKLIKILDWVLLLSGGTRNPRLTAIPGRCTPLG